MRTAGRLLPALLLLAFVAWAAVRYFILTPLAAEKVRAAAMSLAKQSLTEPLIIKGVTIDVSGRIVAKGIKLGYGEKPALEAPSAILHLSLITLLRNPREPGLALKGLTIVKPDVRLLRGADGVWNFQRLLKPPPPGAKPARIFLSLRIRGGKVRIEGAATRRAKPFLLTFSNSNGRAQIDNERGEIRWDLTTNAAFAPALRLTGGYFAAGGLSLRARCPRMTLDRLPKFLIPEKLKIGGEVERLDVTLLAEKGARFPLLGGGFRMRSVSVSRDGLPAPTASGGVRLDGRVVRFRGMDVEIGKGRMEIGGTALVPRGELDIEGTFSGISLEEISKNIAELKGAGLRGRLSGSLRVSGALDAPAAVVEVKADGLAFRKSEFDSAGLVLTYDNGVFSVIGAEALRGEGAVWLQGWGRADGDWKDWSGGLSLQAEGMPSADFLGEMGIAWRERVAGNVSGIVVAAKKFDGPLMVSGNLRGERIEVGAYPATLSVDAAFHGDGDGLTMENLVVSEGENFIAARGRIAKNGAVTAAIDGCGWDAGRLAAFAGREKLPVSGWMECGGAVSGTVDNLAVDIAVKGHDLALGEVRSLTLRGAVAKKGDVWSSDVKLTGRSVSVTAEVEAAGGGAALTVSAKGLPLKELVDGLKTAGVANFSHWKVQDGEMDGDAVATLKAGKWKAAGSASARKLQVHGESAESASVNFAYDGVLKLHDGRLNLGGDKVAFSGELTGKRMRLDVSADAVALDALQMFSAFRLSGRPGFKASVAGPYGGTTIKGSFSPADVVMRNVPFREEGGTFTYKGRILAVDGVTVRRGVEKYDARGSYDVARKNLDVDVKFENADPATFQRFFNVDFPEKAAGAVNGSLKVIGLGGEISGTIALDSDRLAIGDFTLTRMEAEGGFRGPVVDIKRLYAENEVSKITGEGVIDLSHRSNSLFNLEATSIDLDALARIARLPFSAGGYGDIFIDISGEAGEMRGDIDAYDPSIAGFQFERMRGQFQFTGDAVTLKKFDFLRDGAILSLRAIVPLKGSKQGLEVIMNGENLPLAVFNPFLEKSGLSLKGGFDLHDVAITEGARGPAFGGTVEVKGGELSYAGLKQPMTGVNGLFVLEGDAGALDKFGGEFGGKRVDITGGIFFDGLRPSKVEIAFSDLRDADLEYGKLYKGKVDVAGLYIAGVPGLVELGGLGGPPTVRFHHGVVDLAGLSAQIGGAPATGGSKISFPDRVKIEAGSEIVLRSGSNMRLYPRGELLLGGTLRAPTLKGSLVSTKGFVRPGYSDIVFNIIEPVLIGFYSPGGEGVFPIFYAHGRARVAGLDVYMESSGPMVDLARFPEYQAFCQRYTLTGAGGMVSSSAAPRILLTGGEEEKFVPVCPSVYLYAYRDGVPLSISEIMKHLVRADERSAGTPFSQILTTGAVGMFTPGISSVVEQGINLENFEVNLDPNKDLLVELEKRIASKTYVRIKRIFFSREIKQEVELRYKFRKNSYILWNVDQDNVQTYEVEYRFTF